jgi:hypothetical protein
VITKNPNHLLEIVTFCAQNLRHFTSDHVRLLSKHANIDLNKNSIAGAMLKAKGQKIIKRTDRAKSSDFYCQDNLPRWLWRSLLKPTEEKEEFLNKERYAFLGLYEVEEWDDKLQLSFHREMGELERDHVLKELTDSGRTLNDLHEDVRVTFGNRKICCLDSNSKPYYYRFQERFDLIWDTF